VVLKRFTTTSASLDAKAIRETKKQNRRNLKAKKDVIESTIYQEAMKKEDFSNKILQD